MTEKEQIEKDLQAWRDRRDKFMKRFTFSMNNCSRIEQPEKKDCFNQ